MSKNLDQIVEELSTLTVLDLSKLKEMLENKWGVKAAAAVPAMMMAAAPQAGAAPAASAESTEFEVTLADSPADKRIGVIKVIRELTGLGLKEAKELVEAAPKVVKPNAPKAEAEDIKKKLEASGAKVTLKGL